MCVHAASTVRANEDEKLVRERVPLWKLQPLMSASGLWQTNATERSTNPYKHTSTDKLIEIMTKLLKVMHKDEQHVGRKTLLWREAGFVKLVLKGGESLISKTHSAGPKSGCIQ